MPRPKRTRTQKWHDFQQQRAYEARAWLNSPAAKRLEAKDRAMRAKADKTFEAKTGMNARDAWNAAATGKPGKWQTPVTHAHSGGGTTGWNESDHPRNPDGEFRHK